MTGRWRAGLGAAGDEHVEPGGDGAFEEADGLRGQRAERDEFVEVVGLQDERADVDGHVPPGDVRRDERCLRMPGQAQATRLRFAMRGALAGASAVTVGVEVAGLRQGRA